MTFFPFAGKRLPKIKLCSIATLTISKLTNNSVVSSSAYLSKARTLQFWSGTMVVLPVFVQAPWVHYSPLSALLFSFVIFFVGFYLINSCGNKWSNIGSLLIGVSWSWLGGCLFWGWLRAHPVLHIPVEAVALPLAFIGLSNYGELVQGSMWLV